ncbi:MAG: FAD-dependent oxidoreductase, partial [Anaerolineae bacterium]|nr:FAD-dependent oxidoreductase [Anaerolineae bacterium]NIN96971.1 FAD-dependent oxidoreductase [Anaerolineae bacterium]NIQ82937.1 FAD-dependent oxidoreductase [Anaerolineae bacterium]
QAPDLDFLPDDLGLSISRWGSLEVDPETLATSVPGVFAAGDVVTGPKTVIEGIAAGRQVALGMDRYLGGSGSRQWKTQEFLRIEVV